MSDDDIKFNEVDISNGLQIVRQLQVQRYDKIYQDISGIGVGLIAQEVLLINELEFTVSAENGHPYLVNYTPILCYGLAAIKELDTVVETQQTTIATLQTQLIALEARIATLEGN